jgi:hypothetical protein
MRCLQDISDKTIRQILSVEQRKFTGQLQIPRQQQGSPGEAQPQH